MHALPREARDSGRASSSSRTGEEEGTTSLFLTKKCVPSRFPPRRSPPPPRRVCCRDGCSGPELKGPSTRARETVRYRIPPAEAAWLSPAARQLRLFLSVSAAAISPPCCCSPARLLDWRRREGGLPRTAQHPTTAPFLPARHARPLRPIVLEVVIC